MGTIALHISALIHLHDCVIVPGLGAFVGNYKPAEVIEEKGLFFPPKKEIGFNRSLQHNDGLLCDFIARCEGISFHQAQKQTDDFVQQTLHALSNKQSVVIGDIGELRKDAMGNILFWPNDNSLFLPESFGLSMFHAPIPAIELPQHRHLAVTQNHSQVWLRRIAQKKLVAGITLFVGLFLLINEVKTPPTVATGSFVPSISVEYTTPQPELTASENEDVVINEEQIAPDTTIQVEAASTKIEFYLIAASFPDLTAAEKFKEKMQNEGFANSEVISQDGKNRVAIEKFTSRSDAFDALENFRQLKGFEGVWLLKNTNR